jgi:hypothetical protein
MIKIKILYLDDYMHSMEFCLNDQTSDEKIMIELSTRTMIDKRKILYSILYIPLCMII